MPAVLLSCAAGALYGAVTAALGVAIRRNRDAEAGALATIVVAFVVVLLATAVSRSWSASVDDLWPYALGGVLAPGISQVLFVFAVREAGSSRVGILVGVAPLLAAVMAIAAFGEPVRGPLVAGTVLIVLGGMMLAWEPERPAAFRIAGLFFALGAALAFATRDNVARFGFTDAPIDPLLAATVVTGTGAAVMSAYLLASRGSRFVNDLRAAFLPYAAAGVLFGSSYAAILEAFARGPVTVVSPLVGTEVLWAVAFAWLLLGRSEMIGRRLVAAAALVVAGGALIGAWR